MNYEEKEMFDREYSIAEASVSLDIYDNNIPNALDELIGDLSDKVIARIIFALLDGETINFRSDEYDADRELAEKAWDKAVREKIEQLREDKMNSVDVKDWIGE